MNIRSILVLVSFSFLSQVSIPSYADAERPSHAAQVKTGYSTPVDLEVRPGTPSLDFDRAIDATPDVVAEERLTLKRSTQQMSADEEHNVEALNRAGSAITFTLRGKLFYNDLRTVGRFDWRYDHSGDSASPVEYSPTATNYLGAADIVADVYEIDPSTGGDCVRKELIGKATVNFRGEFEGTFTNTDACGTAALEIGVRFRARFCNSTRCFSVVKDDGVTNYRLWASGLSVSDPTPVAGGTLDIGNRYFQATIDGHDDYAKAANVFASLTETTRVWHRSAGVPFEFGAYGELYADFPSTYKTKATTEGPNRIHIPAPFEWITGGGPSHEFGHVLHQRSWNGTTGGCGDCPAGTYGRDGDSTWSKGSREYPHTALNEGWANFVRRAAEDSCGELDVNSYSYPVYSADDTYPINYPNDGKSFAGNVTKLLCDWYDSAGDDDIYLAGSGDHFNAASLYSVWRNMDEMWDWTGESSGLTICDYVRYYVDERKSAANVGTATHDAYELLIADLAYNNALKCELPRP